jgi:hypothetical protein
MDKRMQQEGHKYDIFISKKTYKDVYNLITKNIGRRGKTDYPNLRK